MTNSSCFPDDFVWFEIGYLKEKGYYGVTLVGKRWCFYLNAATGEVDFQPNGEKGVSEYIYTRVRSFSLQKRHTIFLAGRAATPDENRILSALDLVLKWCESYKDVQCLHTTYSDWGTGAVCCKQCAAMGRWVNGTVVW